MSALSNTLDKLGPSVNAKVQELQAASADEQIAPGLVTAVLIGRGLSHPIVAMTDTMTSLAGGDRTVEVPGLERGDEIGGMAKAVQVFKDSLIRAAQLAAQQAAEQQARQKRAERIDSLTRVSSAADEASRQVLSAADGLSHEAEDLRGFVSRFLGDMRAA